MGKRVAIAGDFHAPFHQVKATEAFFAFCRDFKPDVVVQMGDLYDQYSFSRYSHSLNLYTPQEETALGREGSEWFWKEAQRAAPKARCIQLLGNHDDRMQKRLFDSFPELEGHVDLKHLYAFKGVKTFYDSSEEVVIDGVIYQHGFRSKLGDHAAYNQQSTVTGHSHRGGVVYHQNLTGPYWELNAGWLGDLKHRVFGYRNQKHLHKTTLGWAAIDAYGPRFCPWSE